MTEPTATHNPDYLKPDLVRYVDAHGEESTRWYGDDEPLTWITRTPLWFTDRDPSTVVTLDPESDADVERLGVLLDRFMGGDAGLVYRDAAERILAALAQPEPVPTLEPENLGAVIVDAVGGTYVRVPDVLAWWATGAVRCDWADLAHPITVLHPGYDPDAEGQA